MEYTGLNELREKFLSFFESKGHLRLPSFPLIPKNDASLLLINSGMAPMKPWFTGAEIPPRKRVTTCQKCIRTGDIENVGKTARHGTYFEMLGNFSFGDYFKKEAAPWAWEFFTEVLKIPREKLWVSIYQEDDEAFDIWTKQVGVAPERIVRLGKEDNFWEHGTGPCGPCSEIYFDRGEEYGCGSPTCGVGCDCDRYMEVWNLVFTQFDKDEDGNYNRLEHPNIDTGMGLERLAVVMQGVDNLFEVDTVQDVMKHISKIAGVEYKKDPKTDVSLRVITDHIRSTVMMVSDGVIPSNEGRGYVLRRLLRRAARHGKLLNVNRQFLYEVAETVIETSKSAYPELEEKKDYITKIIQKEEERFDATIDNGLVVLNQYIDEIKAKGGDSLTGEQAFKLHDTYGFPLDLTIEMASEQGLSVDTEGFNAAMNAQKQAARDARADGSSWDADAVYVFEDAAPTEFIGYDTLESDAKIVGLVTEKEVSSVIANGETGFVVTDKTPFYAEMGGEVGDKGVILVSGKEIAKVTNTTKTGDGYFMHEVTVSGGDLTVGDTVTLKVDGEIRRAISRNHSATHLLQQALRDVLGDHVAQAGSLVDNKHLRFDFSHFAAMTKEELKQTEQIVNQKILDAIAVTKREMPIEEARKTGAKALFGEKYGDVVRVVSMGDYSIEFCGGCHVNNTSEIGLFKLLSENGVSAGIRRIEAITAKEVLNYIYEKENLIADTADILKANPAEIDVKAAATVAELKELNRKIDFLREKAAKSLAENILVGSKVAGGVRIVTADIGEGSMDELRVAGDQLKDRIKEPGVIVLANQKDGKINFVSIANKEAIAMGVHAGNIMKEITKIAGGSGGGKPDSARGGGKLPEKIDDALAAVDDLVLAAIK